MKRIARTLIAAFSLAAYAGIYAESPEVPSGCICAEPQVWLTVFVHGIVSLQQHLSLANIVNLLNDTVADSHYAKTVELTRKNPFYYQHHCIQETGLKKIDMFTMRPGAGATAFAHAYDAISAFCQKENTKTIYYTFGWSGLLSRSVRELEATLFYYSLAQELDYYHKLGIYPKVRIISYSHGGNITIPLALVRKNFDVKFDIDELILIGVPIIPDTDFLINNPMFKKIYHIYSYGDRVQALDLFSLSQGISQRTFQHRRLFRLPGKLIQIELRIRRISKRQEKANARRTQRNLPPYFPRREVRKADPGHSELWSFGWTTCNYRKSFPLWPLPAATVIPLVTRAARDADLGNHVIVQLEPYCEQIVVWSKRGSPQKKFPFLSEAELAAVKQEALTLKPQPYSAELYWQHLKEAFDQATAWQYEQCKALLAPKARA